MFLLTGVYSKGQMIRKSSSISRGGEKGEHDECPSGQCIYRALRSINCELSLSELNNALEKRCKEHEKPAGFWGIADDRWHYSVISWAFRHKYGSNNYVFKKIDVNDITEYRHTTGRVIIDGIMNSREWYPDDKDHTDRAQRHCVGADLDRGVFYDYFMDEGRERRSVYKLFAPSKRRTSGVNPYMFSSQSSQQYFRRILKVYMVSVVTNPPTSLSVKPLCEQETLSPLKNTNGPQTRSMKRKSDEHTTTTTTADIYAGDPDPEQADSTSNTVTTSPQQPVPSEGVTPNKKIRGTFSNDDMNTSVLTIVSITVLQSLPEQDQDTTTPRPTIAEEHGIPDQEREATSESQTVDITSPEPVSSKSKKKRKSPKSKGTFTNNMERPIPLDNVVCSCTECTIRQSPRHCDNNGYYRGRRW
jgi:hypothetical protein